MSQEARRHEVDQRRTLPREENLVADRTHHTSYQPLFPPDYSGRGLELLRILAFPELVQTHVKYATRRPRERKETRRKRLAHSATYRTLPLHTENLRHPAIWRKLTSRQVCALYRIAGPMALYCPTAHADRHLSSLSRQHERTRARGRRFDHGMLPAARLEDQPLHAKQSSFVPYFDVVRRTIRVRYHRDS